ncbi:MAG: GAF domain-containing protein [Microscillaceae bacterium]|nr:GAF domain-containing protein [Microscillaceae bacterium]
MNNQIPSMALENAEITRTFYQRHYKKIDAQMAYFVWGYALLGFVWAYFYDTYILAFLVAASHLAIYYLCYFFFRGTLFSRSVISLMLWSFASAYLIQMNGMYEMHFFFFVSAATLIHYHDWRAQLPLFTFALIHHLVLAILDLSGIIQAESFLFNQINIQIVIIHLAIVLIDTSICIQIAVYVRKVNIEQLTKSSLLEKQMKFIENDIQFAEEISKGNLQVSFSPLENDKLGWALSNMQKSLLKANEREKNESFINIGLVEINRILRENAHSAKDLSEKFLAKLVQILKIQQGCIFIKNQNNLAQVILELKAAYACDRNKISTKEILPGEGLVGQSFLEGKTLMLDQLPEDYIHTIPTGLGSARPRFVVITPIKVNERIEGVLELASFQKFEEYSYRLIEKAAESLAITLQAAQSNEIAQLGEENTQILSRFSASPNDLPLYPFSKQELEAKKKELETQLAMIQESLIAKRND